MNNCAESQTRACKAYITNCYSQIAQSYNKCKSGERQILKKNIFEMLDRIKLLLDNKPIIEDDTTDDENESDSAE